MASSKTATPKTRCLCAERLINQGAAETRLTNDAPMPRDMKSAGSAQQVSVVMPDRTLSSTVVPLA